MAVDYLQRGVSPNDSGYESCLADLSSSKMVKRNEKTTCYLVIFHGNTSRPSHRYAYLADLFDLLLK